MQAQQEVEIKSNIEKLELYSDQYPFSLPLRIKNFENEADYNKFIKNCEKLIRGSVEYKQWRNYITDVLQVNSCFVTNERMDECTLEIHHHIPSLFTLLKALVNKNMDKDEAFSTFDVCMEAIEIHFANKVGYIAVISSIHEKIHNNCLDVPKNMVQGNYMWFIENFSKYLDDDDLDVINKRLSISDSNFTWTKNNYPGMKEIKA
jgi:hypothetical protein